MATLGTYVSKLAGKIGGRTDINDKITQWLMESYREIAMSYDLETLETSVEVTWVVGTAEYAYPDDARAIKAFTYLQGNSPVVVTKKDIRIVRRHPLATGAPAIWAPFGAEYILRPVPNLAYVATIDYWRKPDIDETSSTTINQTEIELPDDWIEVFLQLAKQKAHNDLTEMDKAQATHQLLFGDPNSSKGFPGMIKERLNRNAAENAVSSYGMRPRVRPYGRT